MQYTARVMTSTINRYVKQEIAPIFRKSVLLGLLKARGRIKYKVGGLNIVWTVRYLRRQLRDVLGAVTATEFPNVSTKIQATMGWAAYDMGESIAKMEKLVNQGSEVQIYNLYESVLKELLGDFTEQWRLRLWQDGTVTGTGLMGILSMFGGSSTPTGDGIYSNAGSYSRSTAQDGTTPWWCCSPNNSTTYAGISTALGAKVSDYSNPNTAENYPKGSFSPGLNFFTPLYIDYNSRAFTPNPAFNTGIHCWDQQWQQAFNALTTYMGTLQKEQPNVVVLDPDLYMRAENSTIGQQRFVVTDSSETRVLGFKSVEYNGQELLYEYGVPSGMAFALNIDKLNYYCMQGQLIERTEDEDIVTSEDLVKFDNYGQLWAESPPRNPTTDRLRRAVFSTKDPKTCLSKISFRSRLVARLPPPTRKSPARTVWCPSCRRPPEPSPRRLRSAKTWPRLCRARSSTFRWGTQPSRRTSARPPTST